MKFPKKKAKAEAEIEPEQKPEQKPVIAGLTATEAAELADRLARTCHSGHTHDTCAGSVFCDYLSGHLPL